MYSQKAVSEYMSGVLQVVGQSTEKLIGVIRSISHSGAPGSKLHDATQGML